MYSNAYSKKEESQGGIKGLLNEYKNKNTSEKRSFLDANYSRSKFFGTYLNTNQDSKAQENFNRRTSPKPRNLKFESRLDSLKKNILISSDNPSIERQPKTFDFLSSGTSSPSYKGYASGSYGITKTEPSALENLRNRNSPKMSNALYSTNMAGGYTNKFISPSPYDFPARKSDFTNPNEMDNKSNYKLSIQKYTQENAGYGVDYFTDFLRKSNMDPKYTSFIDNKMNKELKSPNIIQNKIGDNVVESNRLPIQRARGNEENLLFKDFDRRDLLTKPKENKTRMMLNKYKRDFLGDNCSLSAEKPPKKSFLDKEVPQEQRPQGSGRKMAVARQLRVNELGLRDDFNPNKENIQNLQNLIQDMGSNKNEQKKERADKLRRLNEINAKLGNILRKKKLGQPQNEAEDIPQREDRRMFQNNLGDFDNRLSDFKFNKNENIPQQDDMVNYYRRNTGPQMDNDNFRYSPMDNDL